MVAKSVSPAPPHPKLIFIVLSSRILLSQKSTAALKILEKSPPPFVVFGGVPPVKLETIVILLASNSVNGKIVSEVSVANTSFSIKLFAL